MPKAISDSTESRGRPRTPLTAAGQRALDAAVNADRAVVEVEAELVKALTTREKAIKNAVAKGVPVKQISNALDGSSYGAVWRIVNDPDHKTPGKHRPSPRKKPRGQKQLPL